MPRGYIYYVNLPPPIGGTGPEESGTRPAVCVLSDTSPINNPKVMIVPITAQLSALRFPFTFQLDPSTANGLTQPSVLLVFQLRAIGRRRLLNSIGQLENHYLTRMDNEIRTLLSL